MTEQERRPVLRFRPLLGRPVIDGRGGARLGRIQQIILDIGAGRLIGFRLRRGGLLDRRWRVAAFEDVVRCGPDGVTVVDAVALREDERGAAYIALGGRAVTVVNEDGSLTGRLTDAAVDEQTGAIAELVVTPRTWFRRSLPPVRVPLGRTRRCRNHVVVLSDTETPSAAECGRALRPVDQPA